MESRWRGFRGGVDKGGIDSLQTVHFQDTKVMVCSRTSNFKPLEGLRPDDQFGWWGGQGSSKSVLEGSEFLSLTRGLMWLR